MIGGFSLGLHYVGTNLGKDNLLNYNYVAEDHLILSVSGAF
jgi:hypothetical protein